VDDVSTGSKRLWWLLWWLPLGAPAFSPQGCWWSSSEEPETGPEESFESAQWRQIAVVVGKGKRSVLECTQDSLLGESCRWQQPHNYNSTHYRLLIDSHNVLMAIAIGWNYLSVHDELHFMLSLAIIFAAQMSYQVSVPPLLATLNGDKNDLEMLVTKLLIRSHEIYMITSEQPTSTKTAK
jgi:hypothetical protein